MHNGSMRIPVRSGAAPSPRLTEQLVRSIAALQTATVSLSQRVDRGEAALGAIERDIRQLLALTDNGSPTSLDSEEGRQMSAISQRIECIQNQLELAMNRMVNHEKAVTLRSMQAKAMTGVQTGPFEPTEELARTSPQTFAVGSAPRLSSSDDADRPSEEFPALHRTGQQESLGSTDHPYACRPCSFYCFSKRGCKKGQGCDYCHMLHVSRKSRGGRAVRAGLDAPDQGTGRAYEGWAAHGRTALEAAVVSSSSGSHHNQSRDDMCHQKGRQELVRLSAGMPSRWHGPRI